MLVYRGEKRYLSVDLTNVLAEEDELAGTPTAEAIAKRGRVATDLVVSNPAAPGIDDAEVTFWVEVPEDQEPGNYFVIVECGTAAGETVREEAPLIVQ